MQERKKRNNRNEGKTNEQTKLKERKIKQKYVQNNQQRKN